MSNSNLNLTTHVFTVSELTPQLWSMMKAEPEDTIWYSLIGTLLQAMLVTSVLGMTIKYFTYFTNRDSPYLLWGIGIGTTIQIAELMLTCAEDYRLVYCGPDNFQDIFRFLVISDMIRLLTAAMFNIAAGGYYTWRVWMMCGRKIYMVPPFAIGGMVQMMMTVMAVVHGCKLPEITVDTIMQLPQKMPEILKFFKIWGAVTLVVDGALCIIMTILLFKTQDSLFSKETKVFRKLISLVYETMLPPVVCLIILEAASGSKGTPLTDMRRIITCILPVLYYHSALHTLCGRQDLRDLLEDKLASGGIHALSNGSGKGSGGRVYAAYPPGLRSLNIEESGIEMQSPISSSSTRKNPQMPMIKVEQTTVVSRSDEYVLSTPEPISMPTSRHDDPESDDEKSVMTNKSAPVHHS
ncbi:hypothetical protein I302_107054 [Kwoniella bestiolae CBS 10118]|uniref:Uncharacterized protein n=1 Tax=Kwoniella bestiolae CBS 10118 TaxID=1296100 RepID=A0A1B9FZN2_9TREE|nr:hypothetical protein I302_05681 [Kwoniella bestiolae CBS 10118]OCF24222.1 hypothetical protein I302_05681 [Kwoniella bestiolae CBS 10118]